LIITTKWLAVAVGLIVVVGAGIYVPLLLQPSTSNGTTTSCSTTWTTSMSTTTVTQSTTLGSFSYSPAKPVKIDDVRATVTQGSGGDRLVTFSVLFENVGTSPVYVAGGCGSGLTASVPASSSVLQRFSSGPVCACAEFIGPVNPGQNHTSVTPGCWTVYHYRLTQPGTVTVDFTLSWWADGQNLQQANSTNISATFTFA
jgi:hypothetical protein